MFSESPDMKAGTPSDAFTPRKWRLRRVLSVALAVLILSGALEILYRAYWVINYRWTARNDKNAYFSLYVVGESTAAGEPYNPGITLAALVRNLLEERLQGKEIKVFNLARSGESAYPQAVALEHALRLRNGAAPGVVLIYSGHADAIRPHGLLSLEWLREKVLCRSMLLGDLSFFAEKKLPFLRVRTRQTYEYHMRRIAEMSLKSGLVPIIATVASNISNIDPGLFPEDTNLHPDLFRPGLSRAEMEAILGKGLAMEEQGSAAEAIRYYSDETAAHTEMRPYLEYRIGKCHQAQGRYAEAKIFYQQVVDLAAFNTFPRATSRQNDFIRTLAGQYSMPLVDTVKIFEEHSPHGLLGDELFSDGCHPNIKGYILLANAFAGAISGAFNEPVRRRWTGADDVFRAFSYGRENQANALITSGRNLFNVAAWHAWPVERLKMARGHFISAIGLNPRNFSAWMALGWTEIAMRSTLLSEKVTLYWLLKHGLLTYHCGPYGVTPAQFPEILEKLASYGPPGSTAATIPRAAAAAQDLNPGKGGEYALTRGQLQIILKKLYGAPGANLIQ